MSNRILLTHATRTSSTAEVADVISEVLTSRGFAVDVRDAPVVPDDGDVPRLPLPGLCLGTRPLCGRRLST